MRGFCPRLAESGDEAGSFGRMPRDHSACPAGIAVAMGGADAPAAALGLGLAREEDAKGVVLISLGTGGQVARARDRAADGPGRTRSTVYATWCPASGASWPRSSRRRPRLDWVVRLLRPTTPTAAASCSPPPRRSRPAATG